MPAFVAIIIGGIVGAAMRDGFSVLGGAALGWLLLRSFRQEAVVAKLQQQLRTEPLKPDRPRVGVEQPPRAPADSPEPPEPVRARPIPRPTPVAAMEPEPAARLAAEVAPPTVAEPTVPPTPRPDWLAPVKQWLFGGNTIVKAGVGILFIGLAFLAKFASEHIQVPIEVRLAIIAAVAVALLGLGWRLRHRRAGYAQVLQGGAVAILYLTLFVAFRFYGVLAVGPVFAMMVLVAALAAALAVLQDSRSLAVIGALGGFATPLLVSTGSGNHIALFSYYLVLDLGIAAVAWNRTWRSLNLIGFVGTFVVGTAWGVLKYQPEYYASGQGFLIGFFVLFAAIMLMPARPGREGQAPASRADTWVNGSLLFGLPTITFALQYGLVGHTQYGTAISALVLAGFYVALATRVRSRPRMAVAFEASLAIGTVFLTLVIPFALDARSTAGAWALEGAGLVWLGFRQSRGMPRVFGYLLLLMAGGAMMMAQNRYGLPTAFFNATFFNALMAAAASLAAALFVTRSVPKVADQSTSASRAMATLEGTAEPTLIAWGTLWLVVAAAVQINAFLPGNNLAEWLAVFSGIALLYAGLSTRFEWPRVGLPPVLHAPLHGFGILIVAITLSRPTESGGWWAWSLALVTHGVIVWKLAANWPAWARNLVHALGVLVLAGFGALEGRAITAGWGDPASAWSWLGWLVAPAALLMWLPRPTTARRWPMSAAPAAYQSGASAVLAAGLLLWTVLANSSSNGSALPLPHLPLVNPLDLGVGVALLAIWLWSRSEAGSSVARPGFTTALLGGAGFWWLNAILIRAFFHYGDVPFAFDAWTNSLAVQTGITLLWTVTALVLMWWSARRAMRLPWMVGAALLAAVVLKLLLVDLSATGTVTRIISFIGVGVLMLVIGYVAPLPSKRETP